ncbi:MAG: hypothetical protein JST49_00970 [Bacteroidetes bacterium]|nr:hypothetical protein [Bacteroidota bacterium]
MTALTMELNPVSSMGAVFDPPDFRKFKGFLIAASIAYGHLLKKRQGKYSVPIRGETTGKPVSFSYLPTGQIIYTYGDEVANIYLAKPLGFGKTTGGNFKKRAKQCQYIDVKPNYADMKLSVRFLESMKKSYPEIAHKMVSRRSHIYLQLPDRVKSHIKLRRIKLLRRLLPYNKLQSKEER